MFKLSTLHHVPDFLCILALYCSVSLAQTAQLSINESVVLDTANLLSTTYTLPQASTSRLTVSVSLCGALSSDDEGARYFVTNNSAVTSPGPNSTESDVYEITIGSDGTGNVTLTGGDGGVFAVSIGSVEQSFEVGVSDAEPMNEPLSALPLLGDTTGHQAILFSPPFSPVTIEGPSYPNYTLPDANLTEPTPPTQFPNYTLLVGTTESFPPFNISTNSFSDGSPVTACALKSRQNMILNSDSNFENVQTKLVLRDADGWRMQWLVDGLVPSTNYTAFAIQNDTKISGPIYFTTKSASFSCPLVHSVPYCPLVSYSVPLPIPPGEAYDASNLPESISGPLISYMSNFTTSLLTFACGRDWYSPLVGCNDCQLAYRTWLCAVQLPRCGESPPTSTSTSASSGPTRRSFWRRDSAVQATLALPALMSQSNESSTARTNNLPTTGNWTELLPCLETCNAVDRACPPFLSFTCPVPRFNARDSYGVGFIDGDAAEPGGEWTAGGGITGKAQDRWGNVWCNGPGLTE